MVNELGEKFSMSGPEAQGFSSLGNVFWNLGQEEIYKIILGHFFGIIPPY